MIGCNLCRKRFQSLGFARHRSMHYAQCMEALKINTDPKMAGKPWWDFYPATKYAKNEEKSEGTGP